MSSLLVPVLILAAVVVGVLLISRVLSRRSAELRGIAATGKAAVDPVELAREAAAKPPEDPPRPL